jgi:uncharacterized protein (TIGR04255 family)
MRPADLPDFAAPPLDEVVLSVQFGGWPGFQSVHLGDVWQMFRAEYPDVFEHPPLPPQFETFGGGPQEFSLPIRFPAFFGVPRLWFVSKDGFRLLQFQSDRFVANWRRVGGNGEYPRFESVLEAFQLGASRLDEYAKANFSSRISANQAEVSYINLININGIEDVSEWLKLELPISSRSDSLIVNIPETILSGDGKPIARLYQEIQFVKLLESSQNAIRLSFTYRGRPSSDSVDDAIAFIFEGREAIVNRFAEITTDRAQTTWGRK